MEVRITFKSEVYIEGDSIEDIKAKWDSLPLFSADALEDCGAEVVDTISVEDANTYEDLKYKFDL